MSEKIAFGDDLNRFSGYLIIPTIICLLFFFQFFVKPYFQKRDALNVVTAVLTHWQNNDLTLAMSYWEKEINTPPVYGLLSYEIGNTKFDKKDGMHRAQITAALEFPSDDASPSKKEWLFVLNKTRYGWKVVDFRRVKTSPAINL